MIDFTPRRISPKEPSMPSYGSQPHRPVKKQLYQTPRRNLSSRLRVVAAWVRHYRRIVIGLVCIAVAWFAIAQLNRPALPSTSPPHSNQTRSTSNGSPLEKGTPSYITYLPKGKTIEQLGGWTRVSPSSSNPVYAYTDTIGAIQLIVSQQAMPDSFKDDPEDQLKELAQNYGANEHITVNNRTVYVGTSSKGPQSLLFFIDKTLLLIKSSTKLSNDQWVAYIAALQ
jgi:hypothetical protein